MLRAGESDPAEREGLLRRAGGGSRAAGTFSLRESPVPVPVGVRYFGLIEAFVGDCIRVHVHSVGWWRESWGR